MRYDFLVETYATERLKVISVWSEFRDEDLPVPTADTGGLMQNHAPTIYAYGNIAALLEGETAGGAKAPLPGTGGKPVTERPDRR
jgi:hypothetical protein